MYFLFFSFFCTLSLHCCIFDEELGFSGYKILTFFCYIHMVSFLYHHSFSFEMVDMRKEGSLQGINHLYNGSLLARYIQQQYQEVIQVMFNQQNFMFLNEATLLLSDLPYSCKQWQISVSSTPIKQKKWFRMFLQYVA